MRFDKKYDKYEADRLFEWQSDEWMVDTNGNLVLKEDNIEPAQNNIELEPVQGKIEQVEGNVEPIQDLAANNVYSVYDSEVYSVDGAK